jgi:diguanylate cyclase (GGDEF)-like protein
MTMHQAPTPAPVPPGDVTDRIVLETVAAILEGQLDMNATLGAVARAAQRSLKSDRASCFVHDGADTRIVSVHTTADDPRERAFLEGSVGLAAARLPICRLLVDQEDVLLVVEDVLHHDRIPPKLAERLGSGAIVGVRLEHRTVTEDGRPALLGTLFLSFREPRRMSAQDLSAARTLGGLAALAIANARLHARALSSLAHAEQRAALDPLTGLDNHRTFHEALRREVGDAEREGHDLALVLMDLDHFKQVNDTYGHQTGDRVLIEVAARLSEVAREEDVIARIGGEEFGWILRGTDASGALVAAERAREAISAEMATVGMLTASAGVCDLAAARDANELFELADGALYWAKAHGRDVAIRYAPDVVTDLSAEERAERLERVRALAGLRALARAVDAKDHSTRRHSERVAHVAVQLATAAGWPVSRAARLHEAGLLHDVGKIGLPDAVLFKPGRLTLEEFEQVKQHAALGANIAAEVLDAEQAEWIRHHHERWDGTGYPDGLAGAEAGDGAHILALADAWDVMTSLRSYKSPLAVQAALAECRAQAGRQFAPWTVDALERLVAAGAIEARAAAPAPVVTPVVAPADPATGGFAAACRQALDELRMAMGWEQAFLTRIREDELEIVAVSGADVVETGIRMPVTEAFCHRMLTGVAPPGHGRLSRADSGYADLAVRAETCIESYSGHPVRLPDGSLFGTLCVIDRGARSVSAPGRELGEALARLIAWEAGREGVATALGRARAGLAG